MSRDTGVSWLYFDEPPMICFLDVNFATLNQRLYQFPHLIYRHFLQTLLKLPVMIGKRQVFSMEETMMQFLEGDIDVLVATAIIENGLDIPNANTMIINNAQNFGLSDLHQMRGRVGRSNKKAFCYMLIPSYGMLTDEAQKRLRAIEEFSTIGSGLNIAMRDLDIRGAGNILGAEQSGFISDIGYDMYHKILNEAIEELKETEFSDLFRQEIEESKEYVNTRKRFKKIFFLEW